MDIDNIFSSLIKEMGYQNNKTVMINKVVMNSKEVEKNNLFIAIRGGNAYVNEALEKGAFVIYDDNTTNLNNNPNDPNKISFMKSYKDLNSDPSDTVRNFKISVGAIPSLDQNKIQENNQNYNNSNYDGGAGKYTKITESQADYFLANYDILDYYGNDESGFSATVFKN